jgi:hypothetical protein
MLSECLDDSSMRLGVPFIAPRQLGAVGGQLGRPNLPSDRWSSGSVGAPDTVRCAQPTVAAGHASPADCAADRCTGDRWLTGQSGEL